MSSSFQTFVTASIDNFTFEAFFLRPITAALPLKTRWGGVAVMLEHPAFTFLSAAYFGLRPYFMKLCDAWGVQRYCINWGKAVV